MGSVKRKAEVDPTMATTTAAAAVETQAYPPPQKMMREDNTVACVHDVSYPEGYVVPPSANSTATTPAKEFPFTLDPFQAEAIKCLETGESVMVIVTVSPN